MLSNKLFRLYAKYYQDFPFPETQKLNKLMYPGFGFFPICSGVSDPEKPFPKKPILILGQDFGHESYLEKIKEIGHEEDKNPTWVNLNKLLIEAGVKPETCFYSNCFPGVRVSEKITGPLEARKDKAFVQHCQQFMIEQIKVLQPRGVLLLGLEVVKFVRPVFPELTSAWKGFSKTSQFNTIEKSSIEVDLKGDLIPFGFLIHPSFRGPNLWRRAGNSKDSQSLEIDIIRTML